MPVREFYAEVVAGEPVAVIGSAGFLELAVNQGSAARQLQIKVGEKVTVRGAVNAARAG